MQRYRKLGKIIIVAPIATHCQWSLELYKWKAVGRFPEVVHPGCKQAMKRRTQSLRHLTKVI